MSALGWSLLINTAILILLAVFIAEGMLEKVALFAIALMFDLVALGMFINEWIGAKGESKCPKKM